jgi:hypothetical protein
MVKTEDYISKTCGNTYSSFENQGYQEMKEIWQNHLSVLTSVTAFQAVFLRARQAIGWGAVLSILLE